MKKTDLAMIVLIATISVLGAFFITRAIVGTPESEVVKVKTIEKIDAKLDEPDPLVFNSGAINPAVRVQIDGETVTQGNNSNANPTQ